MNQTPTYPCNRGDKYNTLNRGYHRFEANAYGVCCIYCGERGPETPYKVTYADNRWAGSCPICGQHHQGTWQTVHPSYIRNGTYV